MLSQALLQFPSKIIQESNIYLTPFLNVSSPIFSALQSSFYISCITYIIIAETYILIRRGIGYQAAITFLENIASSPRVVKIYSDRILEETAESILRQYRDRDFSYTDAVSFIVMKQYGITEVFSFDKHFVTAGFTLVP